MPTRRIVPLNEVPSASSASDESAQDAGRADNLAAALDALRNLLGERIRLYLERRTGRPAATNSADSDDLGRFQAPMLVPEVRGERENFLLLLALIPHVKPDFFESVIMEYMPGGGDFPLFGGVKAAGHRGLLPTGETAQFVLAGDALNTRPAVWAGAA